MRRVMESGSGGVVGHLYRKPVLRAALAMLNTSTPSGPNVVLVSAWMGIDMPSGNNRRPCSGMTGAGFRNGATRNVSSNRRD